MVDSFCARAATDDSPLEDKLKSGGGFWGTGGLFASVVVVCPADTKSFGSDGRGFFGGNGFDLLLAVLGSRVLGDVLGLRSLTASGCLVSLALRKDGGVVSTLKPLIFRMTGGEVLLATPIGLRGVGGENLLP